jgi:hypothetical protein
MRKVYLLILIFMITLSAKGFAQKYSATVDKSTVSQGERFQAYFTFSGGDMNSIKNFRAPDFRGLTVLSGPNESSSIQMVNGAVSSTVTYSYVLVAQSVGTFTIGSSSLFYKGKRFVTKPIRVKVIKGKVKAKSSNSSGISDEELMQNVFIRAIPNKTTLFKGEQLILTYKLYTRLNISSPQISQLPSYKGFWNEELEMLNRINFHVEMYKGKRFKVATIKKIALFPTETGKLTITPFELKVPIVVQKRRRSGDIFDDFFSDPFFNRTQTIEKNIASNRVVINAKPLPAGAPASFTGAVGKFGFKVSIDKLKAKVNDPITIKIKLTGTGNIELAQIPELKMPEGFEVYDPKTSNKITRKNYVSGTKTVEYLVVPRISGKRRIDPISFTYFDTQKKKYVTTKFGPYTLQIEQGSAVTGTQSTPSGFSKEDIQLLNKDIRFIKTGNLNLTKQIRIQVFPAWLIYTIAGSTFLFLILSFVEMRRRKLSGNVELIQSKKSEKEARKRLKEAKKSLEKNELAQFYSNLAAGLFGYLETKLRIPKSEFTLDKAEEKMKALNIPVDLISEVRKVAEKSEYVRFAPSSADGVSGQELYEDTVKLIVKLESKIGKVK